MRNPLLPIAATFAAGIWSAPFLFLTASDLLVWVAALLLAVAVLLRAGRYFQGFFVGLIGFFLCGAFLAKAEHSVLPARHIESLARRGAFRPQEPARLVGWAGTPSVLLAGEEHFDLNVTGIQQGASSAPAEGIVRLYYYTPRTGTARLDVVYGTRIAIQEAGLRRPRNYMTAGLYDFEASMKRQGIYFTGLVRHSDDLQVLPGRDGSRWRASLYGVRKRLLANLDRLYPPERDSRNTGAILKAMLLGDENWLTPETESAFRESGTFHLLVVAGLHVGALAFGLFCMLSWARLPDWLTTLVVFLCVVVYTFLAEARIPAMRAALMISLYLVARLVYRKHELLNSIAAAALILLVGHPADLFDSGFQLSFLAVLVIAAVAAPLAEWTLLPYRLALQGFGETQRDRLFDARQKQFRHDLRTLLDLACDPAENSGKMCKGVRAICLHAVSALLALAEAAVAVAFIQAGLAISMAFYFNRVVWLGIASNLLVIPLTALLVPLGFLVLAASLIWWPAAAAGSRLLGALVWLLRAAVEWPAHWPRFLAQIDRRVATPPFVVLAVFAAALLLIALFASRRSRWVWMAVAGLVPLCVFLTLAPYTPLIAKGRLEVTALDVGQGDSLFVSFPQGQTMLVDGGGEIPIPGSPPPRFDIGESIVSPYLWSRRLKTINVVVLTHAHADHLGGLMSVLRNFKVGELWIGPGPRDRGLDRLLELAASRGVPVVKHWGGERSEIGGVEELFLSPGADWSPKRVSNNDSLVIRLGLGSRHILLSGDVEARMEKRLVDGDLSLASDILKVPHHGSKTSTTAPFLDRVAPQFGIISVGAFGRFGHPNREVLDALAGAHVRTYRTDLDGSVTASTDGNRIEFSVFRDTLRAWPPFPIASAFRPSAAR